MTLQLSKRDLLGAALVSGATAAIPRGAAADAPIVLNDASRLNPTPVAKHMICQREPQEILVAALRAELKDAAAAARPLVVGAARHSMGGQSLPRDGTAITLDSRHLDVDSTAGTYRVDAGARWADVIKTLDPLGFSPLVMQSNNDFGVASTFCVNAHGWPVRHGPFGSTVRSCRMLLADGSLVTCSRTENAELFALAMGGYGLFGIILDLDVEMTPNTILVGQSFVMPAADFCPRFLAAVHDPQSKMAYGRLSLARASFFEEALLTFYHLAPTQAPPAMSLPDAATTRRIDDMYRAQIGSEAMKAQRWRMETEMAPLLSVRTVARNTLMDEPVSNLANNDATRTDILHEYFVSPDRFPDFLAVCRAIIPKAKAEFINVTLRYIDHDPTSRMAYASEPRIAAVMSFSQAMTRDGEIDMMAMTQQLIDGMIGIGGTFYLPYRLHARRDQVRAAYAATPEFVEKKRAYDPALVFRNAMWTAYFA